MLSHPLFLVEAALPSLLESSSAACHDGAHAATCRQGGAVLGAAAHGLQLEVRPQPRLRRRCLAQPLTNGLPNTWLPIAAAQGWEGGSRGKLLHSHWRDEAQHGSCSLTCACVHVRAHAGDYDAAIDYLTTMGGIAKENDYEYLGQDDFCAPDFMAGSSSAAANKKHSSALTRVKARMHACPRRLCAVVCA